MQNTKTVYLAGPITGLTFAGCTSWRNHAAANLADHIQPLSPLRAKEYLCNEGALSAMGYEDHPLSSPKGITARDRFDCQRADVVLFNFLGAKNVSIGTCIEIGWADAARKPIVVVMEKDNIHNHAILNTCAGFIVDNLDDGIALVNAILS